VHTITHLQRPVAVSPHQPMTAKHDGPFARYVRWHASTCGCEKSDFASDALAIGLSWPDKPGGLWERNALTPIRLFSPVISANTEREEKERPLSIPRRRFPVPAIVAESYDPSRYQQSSNVFKRLDFAHTPAGELDAHLIAMLTGEIRVVRRTVAS